MFTQAERLISLRNLRPKKKEGFLKVISIFSFLGIMLGVAILIIVMSVMNGFKTDLTKKILGLNPHIVIESNSFKIEKSFEEKLKKKFEEISISKTFSGEGIVMNNDNAKGIIIKGISLKETRILIHKENGWIVAMPEASSNSVMIPTRISCVLLGDLGVFQMKKAMKEYPSRVLNFGIMEQTMIGFSAGIAKGDYYPIIYSITPFLVDRAYEQIKLDLIGHIRVKIYQKEIK